MGILKKLNDLIQANLTNWLDKAEDPQKLHAQKILDLESSKKSAERLLISAMASLKLAQKKQDQLAQELALQKDRALTTHENNIHSLEVKYQEISTIISEEQDTINTINRGLKSLNEKINFLKNMPISLKNQPLEQDPLSPSQDYIHDTQAFETFNRMEEKIESNEAEIEAFNELLAYLESKEAQKPKKTGSTTTPSLEDELLELKKKLKNE
ncbi:MAG: PspA/IM30 family protein [bacterium ADurb.BinA186]|nr:MAG: PspA/IM30 family protein [bacterium ADurb.BinA186]